MEEIIKSVKEAEERAVKIKAEAYEKASVIDGHAEAEASEILKRNESDCKILRETELLKAEKSAQKAYDEAIACKKKEAKTYADGVIKKSDSVTAKIVGRILSGSC